eukprot:535792-Pelagomonas_calceolata.AAC.6
MLGLRLSSVQRISTCSLSLTPRQAFPGSMLRRTLDDWRSLARTCTHTHTGPLALSAEPHCPLRMVLTSMNSEARLHCGCVWLGCRGSSCDREGQEGKGRRRWGPHGVSRTPSLRATVVAVWVMKGAKI